MFIPVRDHTMGFNTTVIGFNTMLTCFDIVFNMSVMRFDMLNMCFFTPRLLIHVDKRFGHNSAP